MCSKPKATDTVVGGYLPIEQDDPLTDQVRCSGLDADRILKAGMSVVALSNLQYDISKR